MAVPRKRKSKSRRNQQRSHDALKKPIVGECPSCGAPKAPHRVCGACGAFAGREVLEVDAE